MACVAAAACRRAARPILHQGIWIYSNYFRSLIDSEADGYGIVHPVHQLVIKRSHSFLQPLLINGSYLFKQYHRVLGQPVALSAKFDVGG